MRAARKGKPIEQTTPLAKLIVDRGLNYEAAAVSIREYAQRAAQREGGEPRSISTSYVVQLARGAVEPSPALARLLVAWSGGRLTFGDLITVA